MSAVTAVDAVTARVIAGRLEAIADEMAHKLTRMSYSSIIRESEDFGCALLDHRGEQIAETLMSTPLQSGPIPGYVKGVLRHYEEIGETIRPGDVIMHNHAYYGASHGPDVAMIIPIFLDDELVGYSATTAHHLDIGALSPGSVGIVDATDAYAEGLQFNGIKVYQGGERNTWVWHMLRDNIRVPRLVVGDMEAQISAAQAGAQRYLELIAEFGLPVVREAEQQLLDYSESIIRQRILELPDGEYRAEGVMDGMGEGEFADEHLRIVTTVRIKGDAIEVDLSGTSNQVKRPVNMPFQGTVDIAIYVVLRSMLFDSSLNDHVPANSGLYRPITITSPPGTLTNPTYPAPVISRYSGGNVLAGTLARAMGSVLPDNTTAGVGNLKIMAYSGIQDDEYWVYMDITEGSYGGRKGKDGLDAVDTLFANTRNNPIEDIEAHYPLMIDRYELRDEYPGAGTWRGGFGSVRDVRFLDDGGASIEGDGNVFPPVGVFGGESGRTGSLTVDPGLPTERALPAMSAYQEFPRGTVLRSLSPCGGGYGDPLARDPRSVLNDVLDEHLTAEEAERLHGVVIDASLRVDDDATTLVRQARTVRERG